MAMTVVRTAGEDDDVESSAPLIHNDGKAPADRFHLAYIVYVVLGAGCLVPWDSFTTAVDYFTYLYPDVSTNRAFAVVYILMMLVTMVVVVAFADRSNAFVRINLGLGLFLVSLVAVLLIDALFVKGRVGVYGGYYATLLLLVMCGSGNGFMQGSLVGIAGELPDKYMQAVFVGTAISGVLIAILRIVTKSMFTHDGHGLRKSAYLYFIVSTLVMLLNVVFFNILHKLPVIKYYQDLRRITVNEESKHKDLSGKEWRSKLLSIVGAVKWHGSGISITYILTLSIFPGSITEDVHSAALKDWYPIFLVTIFTFSDLIGKSLTSLCLIKNPNVVVSTSLARLLFWPIFYGCLHGPKYFRTEIPIMVLTCLLGLTNGYLTSALMILSPKIVRLEHAEVAGIVLMLYLVIGLATGSVLSWFWIL